MRHPTPPIASTQYGAFTLDQALAAGWSRSALDRACRSGRFTRIQRGSYCDTDKLTCLTRVVSTLLAKPKATASHGSVANLHGLALLNAVEQPCVNFAPGDSGFCGDNSGVHLHRARIAEQDVRTIVLSSGVSIRATSIARAILDITRSDGLEAAAVTGDHALAKGLLCITDLLTCLSRYPGRPWEPRARQLLKILDARSESPLETVSRIRLARYGVSTPELQVPVYNRSGDFLARPDFLWRNERVIGEADGLLKYDSGPKALREEKLRQERLERAGFIVVRWTWNDIGKPETVVSRINAALERGRANRH